MLCHAMPCCTLPFYAWFHLIHPPVVPVYPILHPHPRPCPYPHSYPLCQSWYLLSPFHLLLLLFLLLLSFLQKVQPLSLLLLQLHSSLILLPILHCHFSYPFSNLFSHSIQAWVKLRKTEARNRKVAILVSVYCLLIKLFISATLWILCMTWLG